MVILSVRGRLVRKFMLAAHDLGMTRGDYIFLDVEIFQVRETMMMTKNRDAQHTIFNWNVKMELLKHMDNERRLFLLCWC